MVELNREAAVSLADGPPGGLLDAAEFEQLDRVSAIELGFPHDFDTSGLVYGTTAARIDDPRPGGEWHANAMAQAVRSAMET